ncbi:hypothetical protein [Leptospira santarosai]|uniref:hypothetical protein n=1 Tax=Leptospira santarosai TaxID=28183 RepID=UPI0026E45E29|nr:hypothetical protein [Leptospira santarosai]MDO6383440.1 hypothetical protein [Leptospira santarosai]
MSKQGIEQVTAEEFRRKLAGLEDKDKLNVNDKQNLKDEAVRLATIFARLFSDDLDRITLWNRIGSALSSACSKANDDIELFVNYCLEHIKADSSSVAASEELGQVISSFETRTTTWKKQFISYISKNHFIILVYARAKWIEIKDGKKEL